MWAELADRPDLARPLYEEAVRRLPGYVVASVHLAELEEVGGAPARAISRLEPLAERSSPLADPEPLGRLAEWLAPSAPVRAAALAERARQGYERLLARAPLAFLDHAAEFFGGAGRDPARALALAEENLANRQNPRAFVLAIEAALAAGRTGRACALAAGVPAGARGAHVPLRALLAALEQAGTCSTGR
jgi:hypothetical protein